MSADSTYDEHHSQEETRATIFYSDLLMTELGSVMVNAGTDEDYKSTYDIIVATDGQVF